MDPRLPRGPTRRIAQEGRGSAGRRGEGEDNDGRTRERRGESGVEEEEERERERLAGTAGKGGLLS